MPRYAFECPHCEVHFTRTLKMGEHPTHACPECKILAPRLWMGQSFGFDFTGIQTGSTANTGVSKNDSPTADRAVGISAEARWKHIGKREKVKGEVRAKSGQRALNRRDVAEGTDYTSGNDTLIAGRKEAGKALDAALQGGAKSVNKEFEKAAQKSR